MKIMNVLDGAELYTYILLTKIQYLIRNIDREFAKQLNFKGIKFPVQNKDYLKKKKKWK